VFISFLRVLCAFVVNLVSQKKTVNLAQKYDKYVFSCLYLVRDFHRSHEICQQADQSKYPFVQLTLKKPVENPLP
jgi:hypothetical protein